MTEIDEPWRGFQLFPDLDCALYQAGWSRKTLTGEPVFGFYRWDDDANQWERVLVVEAGDAERLQEVMTGGQG